MELLVKSAFERDMSAGAEFSRVVVCIQEKPEDSEGQEREILLIKI